MVSALDSLLGILCCVLGQDTFTLAVPLPTQVLKWVQANNPAMDQHPIWG